MIHALKTEPAYFEASAAGIKGFEVSILCSRIRQSP